MIGINAGGIIAAVAAVAGIGCIVVIPIVTGIAVICDGHMRTGEWINGIVIKGRRYPGRLGMAEGTVGWELGCGVVWVGSLGVIAVVAAVTGVGGVGVVSVVAGGAVVCNGSVCTVKRPIISVLRESGGLPAGVGGVALRAIGRQV